jgi:SOS response regulatory protein OraA/RecX
MKSRKARGTRKTIRKRGGASTYTQELKQAKVILNKIKKLLESELSAEMNESHKQQVTEVVDSYTDRLAETLQNVPYEARERDREYFSLYSHVGDLIMQLGETPTVGGRRR